MTEQKSIARRHASERTKLNTIKGEAVFVIWRRKEGGKWTWMAHVWVIEEADDGDWVKY